jgi:hypothetical protein
VQPESQLPKRRSAKRHDFVVASPPPLHVQSQSWSPRTLCSCGCCIQITHRQQPQCLQHEGHGQSCTACARWQVRSHLKGGVHDGPGLGHLEPGTPGRSVLPCPQALIRRLRDGRRLQSPLLECLRRTRNLIHDSPSYLHPA